MIYSIELGVNLTYRVRWTLLGPIEFELLLIELGNFELGNFELGDSYGYIELSAKLYRVWFFEVWRVSRVLLIVYRVRIRVASFLRVTLPKSL